MLNATEQFEAVREFEGVWCSEMEWFDGGWNTAGSAEPVPEGISYHTLLGLFAAAAGCGVSKASEWHQKGGRKEFLACDGNIIKASDDDRLLALVAAYRAGVRA